MKLDRYTEKAQEAILAAQRLATDAESPVLDAEHLLAALLEDPEGIPAVTLRQLGADPAARRRGAGRRALAARQDRGRPAVASTRAPARSSSGPRTRRSGSATSTSPPSTCCWPPPRPAATRSASWTAAGAGQERILRARSQKRARQPARHLASTRRPPTRRSRSTAAT